MVIDDVFTTGATLSACGAALRAAAGADAVAAVSLALGRADLAVSRERRLGARYVSGTPPSKEPRMKTARDGSRRRRAPAREGEIVTTDAGIACFDSKFYYQFWRPITAIQNADKDGNPDTTADPTWQALLVVPGHPEYPSQHGCSTAAFSDALAAALHTRHLDVTMMGGQGGSPLLTTSQHFDTVNDIQKQVVDARVWLGFHFRNSVKQGERLGNNVADWELNRYFQPAP